MPTVLLHYCAGTGLDEEAGRRGKGSPRSHQLARARALGGSLRQKPGQVREKTGPGGPAFLVLLPPVSSPLGFLAPARFRFLTTPPGSTRTPASNTDPSVTQWPTAPSAHSSSPSSPSSQVRGYKGGKGAAFPFLLLLLAAKTSRALPGARSLLPVSGSWLGSWDASICRGVVSFPSLSSELPGGGDEMDLSPTEGLPGEFKATPLGVFTSAPREALSPLFSRRWDQRQDLIA